MRYRFRVGDCSADHPEFQGLLEAAYGKDQPECLCRPDKPARMYIARHASGFVIKRLPNTGPQHSPDCEHYEPPAELSGYGQVAGQAIQENAETGRTVLKLDFPLTTRPGRAPAEASGAVPECVRTDGTRLTMRGLLHYLLDEAELTRWFPRMRGRRSWGVVSREITLAAASQDANKQPLLDYLFIPEQFRVEDEARLGVAQRKRLAPLAESPNRRMIVIAPWREMQPTRYGHRLLLKHLPNMPLQVPEDLHRRLERTFGGQRLLANTLDATLLFVGTISMPQPQVYQLESAALMTCNEAWMPIESPDEHRLLQHLMDCGRVFTKGLRYNLPPNKPLATVVLRDTEPPTALYIVPSGSDEQYAEQARELADKSTLASWWWAPGDEEMPPLPPPASGLAHGHPSSAGPTSGHHHPPFASMQHDHPTT